MCLDREQAKPTKCPEKSFNQSASKSCKYTAEHSSCKNAAMTSRPVVQRAKRDVSKCKGDPQKCLCNDEVMILQLPSA